MFGTIRKHQTWLWGVIILAMILGLVFYFSPASSGGRGQGGGEGSFGSIDGQRITREEYLNAKREAVIFYFFRNRQWPESAPDNRYDVEQATYQRLFIIKKIKDYNIHIDAESVARVAANILAQFGKNGPIPLDTFVEQILKPHATGEDFERYLRHELAREQLFSVLTVSADLVTPQEAQALYVRGHQEIAAEVVFFSGTNYQTSVAAPTPETLKGYYTNQMSTYRIPERVQVTYVSFEATNFIAEADKTLAGLTNLNAYVDQVYAQRGTNYYNDVKSPEEAKQKIRAEMRQEMALNEARKKADEFANQLFDKEPARAENLASLAKSLNLQVKTSAAFDAQSISPEFPGVGNLTREAFKLTPEEPFAGPLAGDNAVYVMALLKKVPAEDPPFETIHDRVLADYRHTQATAMARRAGNDFAKAVATGMAAGKTFDAICADVKIKPVTLPPVAMSTSQLPELGERVSQYQFAQVAFNTTPGKASDFSPTAEGGFLVYVKERLPVDAAKMSAALPEFTDRFRQSRRQEVLNAWFGREFQKAVRDVPQLQPRNQPGQNQGRS